MKLTKRERFLLGVLGTVVLWTGGNTWLIAPAYQEWKDLEQQRLALETEKEAMELYERQFEAQKESDEENDFFIKSLDDIAAVRQLIDSARKSGIEINSLTISEPIAGRLPEKGEESENEEILSRIECTLKVKGSPEGIWSFIGNINSSPISAAVSSGNLKEHILDAGILEGELNVEYFFLNEDGEPDETEYRE